MEKYAVITGDFVSSSKLDINTRDELFNSLKTILHEIESDPKNAIDKPFEISRGDFFQGILDPKHALEAALLIFTQIRKYNPVSKKGDKKSINRKPFADIRLSVGIGEISYTKEKISESDGEAFRNSGQYLDKIDKNGPRIMVTTSNSEVNDELEVYAWMLDAIIDKWSIRSAEVINYKLKGVKQFEMAEKLGIKQPSVKGRLDAANWEALDKLINRYHYIIQNL